METITLSTLHTYARGKCPFVGIPLASAHDFGGEPVVVQGAFARCSSKLCSKCGLAEIYAA